MEIRLSKSKFVAGVQCLKRLYWQVHAPELADETSDSTEALLEQGHDVGRLACSAFPGGVRVEAGRDNLEHALSQTRELMSNPEIPAIFEGTFEYGNVLVRVDVLERRPRKKWRLIEVKSTTDVREHHIADAGIQKHVLSGAGAELSSVCLMHMNRDYIYQGGALDSHRLFRIRNINRRVAKIEGSLEKQLRQQFHILAQPQPPPVVAGRHCSEPVTCEFFSRCNPPIPATHILRLPRIHPKTIEKLTAMGIESIHDIPNEFPLSEHGRVACTSVQTGIAWFSPELPKALENLQCPLYFMDFETVYPAIPRYAGMRPYDQVAFEWSVHIRRTPEAEIEHYEFLADTEADPREEFIASLCSVLGTTGTIVVYNQPFESQRLAELARWVPERAIEIERIQRRLWDLLPVVRKHGYHPEFGGSFSLKSVLPALVPTLSYKDMQVANGREAGLAWESFVRGDLDPDTRRGLKDALLAYCRQDTLGLVRLLERLREVVSQAH